MFRYYETSRYPSQTCWLLFTKTKIRISKIKTQPPSPENHHTNNNSHTEQPERDRWVLESAHGIHICNFRRLFFHRKGAFDGVVLRCRRRGRATRVSQCRFCNQYPFNRAGGGSVSPFFGVSAEEKSRVLPPTSMAWDIRLWRNGVGGEGCCLLAGKSFEIRAVARGPFSHGDGSGSLFCTVSMGCDCVSGSVLFMCYEFFYELNLETVVYLNEFDIRFLLK